MSGIRAENTKPEILVRKLLFAQGFRFRLHRADLDGRPDIVLPKHRAVVFVHGCFWHGHKDCRYFKLPSSNTAFWARKIEGNTARDAMVRSKLRKAGWRILVVWECSTRHEDNRRSLASQLTNWLHSPKGVGRIPQRAPRASESKSKHRPKPA